METKLPYLYVNNFFFFQTFFKVNKAQEKKTCIKILEYKYVLFQKKKVFPLVVPKNIG